MRAEELVEQRLASMQEARSGNRHLAGVRPYERGPDRLASRVAPVSQYRVPFQGSMKDNGRRSPHLAGDMPSWPVLSGLAKAEETFVHRILVILFVM